MTVKINCPDGVHARRTLNHELQRFSINMTGNHSGSNAPQTTKQVFLGGACGTTTWRQDLAIPALEAAGITYYNPQLGVGEWTEAHEAAELQAKAEADVLLFVINDETRGLASVAEVAYLIAARRPLALAIMSIPEEACIDGDPITPSERNDLNRGRTYICTMAQQHNVPVFATTEEAIQYAIELVKAPKEEHFLQKAYS